MEELFRKRINYTGDIREISMQICKDYSLGDFKSNHLILVGYEDSNFILETSKGKYFVKIFAKFRNLEDCKRYIEVMEKAMDAKIAAPKLLKSNQGHLYITKINEIKLRLCVAEFINGKTLFESKEKLSHEEVKFLAHQISLINQLDLKPKVIYDAWAITNFLKEFKKKGKSLSKDDLKLVEPLVKKYKELKIEELPHCFVHGDIIATNLMKDNKGNLWIIDFSVSNYYPRIQELAVLACNLFFEENNKDKSKENLEIALKEYQKVIALTKEELNVLPIYIELAHAMHLLSANFEKVKKNNQTDENEYWLNQGRIGLIQMNH
jgi:homoserine kinase type II